MSYQNPSKTTLKSTALGIFNTFPETLDQGQAEDLLYTIYEELCKVIDPDKEYPPVRP